MSLNFFVVQTTARSNFLQGVVHFAAYRSLDVYAIVTFAFHVYALVHLLNPYTMHLLLV